MSALFGYGSFSEDAVVNSANALYYFSLGLPAFALIKVFSSFFFANHNTRIPFYISLVSVMINVVISVYYFRIIGFIIIPIATTFSSWFNSLILFIFLKNYNLFKFNKIFIVRFFKIIFASLLMGLFFEFLISYFENQLNYSYQFKSLFLLASVLLIFDGKHQEMFFETITHELQNDLAKMVSLKWSKSGSQVHRKSKKT